MEAVQSVSASRPRSGLSGHLPPHRWTTLYHGYARSSASLRSSTRNALSDNIRAIADPAKFQKEAPLPQRDRATRYVSKCYVSGGMRVRKVSNSKSDLQGHSRALTLVSFDRPHTISY